MFKSFVRTVTLGSVIGAVCLSCVSSPLQGELFTGTEHHIYGATGSQLTSARIVKRGESCSYGSQLVYIWVLFYGAGGSIEEAKQSAGIKRVAVVDHSSTAVLTFPGLFYKECTVVWGE